MNVRQVACALALPLFPLVLLVGTLVSPTDSTDNAVQLHAASSHGSAWVAAALFELLAAALIPLAVASVVTAVRERGATLATVGCAFGILGTLGMAAIAFRHVFIYGMAGIPQTHALHALDRVDHVFGPVVLPLMLLAPIAFIVLAGAAVRARIVPRWVLVGVIGFAVVDMLPIPEAEVVQGVVGVATLAVLARAVAGAVSGTAPEPNRRATRIPAEA
jgi:hypothetical protein